LEVRILGLLHQITSAHAYLRGGCLEDLVQLLLDVYLLILLERNDACELCPEVLLATLLPPELAEEFRDCPFLRCLESPVGSIMRVSC
jgi:hypothetical protein